NQPPGVLEEAVWFVPLAFEPALGMARLGLLFFGDRLSEVGQLSRRRLVPGIGRGVKQLDLLPPSRLAAGRLLRSHLEQSRQDRCPLGGLPDRVRADGLSAARR